MTAAGRQRPASNAPRLEWGITCLFFLAMLQGCRLWSENGVREVVVGRASTIVMGASGLLTMPYSVTVDDDGGVYVRDAGDDRIVTFGPYGHHIATLGSHGSGPGELRRPSGLWIRGDTLIIADAGNARIQRWTRNGQYLSMTPLPGEARRGFPISIWNSDSYVVATRGLDGALAKLLTANGDVHRTFGTPPIADPSTRQPMRETIRAGHVPGVFQNMVLPLVTEDYDVWLVPFGQPVVHRYDSLGVLLDSVQLRIPEQQIIEEAFLRTNVVNRDPGMVITLRYVADALVAGESLWLLLNLPEEYPTTVLVVASGRVRDRIVFDAVRGAAAFAVDTVGGRVLFIQPDASVTAAPLP